MGKHKYEYKNKYKYKDEHEYKYEGGSTCCCSNAVGLQVTSSVYI